MTPELPLQSGLIPLLPGLSMPACTRDGSPDAWGRRVIINRRRGLKGAKADTGRLDELIYLPGWPLWCLYALWVQATRQPDALPRCVCPQTANTVRW
jgi:hypothetical protein